MNIYESSWGHGWDTENEDFEGFGDHEPELNVIEFLDSLDDVERVTSASGLPQVQQKPQAQRDVVFDCYAFNAAAYELTTKCLESGIKPTEKQLKNADPLFPEKKRHSRRDAEGVLGRWKSFCSNLAVVEVDFGDGVKRKGLNSKWDKTNRIIAYREDWPSIVDRYHMDQVTGKCLNLRATIQNIGQHYITGSRRHGIPEEYAKARIAECPKCHDQLEETLQPNKRLRKTLPDRWPEVHTVPWQQLDDFIENLCIRHKVSLRKESIYRIASPEPSIVTTWVCARGYTKRGSPEVDLQKGSQRLPCTYRVRTIIPVRLANLPELNAGFEDSVVDLTDSTQGEQQPERSINGPGMDHPDMQELDSETLLISRNASHLPDFQNLQTDAGSLAKSLLSNGHLQELTGNTEGFFEQPQQVNGQHDQFMSGSTIMVTVLLNRAHRGHNPNDKEDYANFPVHPSAKEAVLYEFDLTWDTIGVSRASLRLDMLLKSKAPDFEKATFRFHLMPREVAQLTVELNSQGKISSNDWVRLLKEVDALKKKGTVIFLQQYDVFNPAEEKQPFICVLMTPWMREMAERFSADNVWALDSTFKTCVRGLPLHAAAVPNQDGIGMPVFFMICSADSGSRHENIALRLALTAVFKQLTVRPAAILIDKSRLKYDALSDIIARDEKCWKDGKQVACRLLLCWFCAKKAWVENLLPQLAPEKRRDVYRRLDAMMMAATETEYNNLWTKFKELYSDKKEMMDFLELGWVGTHCAWRPTWPMYGRLFEHGNIETINIVRHFWLFIKYSLFGGRVNQSNSELLFTLVGSAVTNTKPSGGTLEEFYRQKQALCDSRRYHNQASTSAERKRLAAADRYLARYNENKSIFQVLSEPGFLFRLKNCGGDASKTHSVNLLTNFCDCLEMMFTCEHLLAARLVLKHNFVGMYGLLERRIKEGDEPCTQVEDIDLAWLDEREGSDDRAMGLGGVLTTAAGTSGTEWDCLVQEIAHVQMQLSNLQACCEDQLIGSPVAEELSTMLASQLKSLRAFTGGSEQDAACKGGGGGSIGGSHVGIIQEHLKACRLQAVKCGVQLRSPSSSSSSSQDHHRKASYAHSQTVLHPRLGFVHYYKQLKPPKVNKRKCMFCGVYNIVGGAFDVTECRNCSRYLFLEMMVPR